MSAFVGFAVLVIGLIGVQLYHFEGRNYQLDEVITVHLGRVLSPREVIWWMATDNHPPLWRVTATSWVAAFGQTEAITRWLSVLHAVLTLAVTYRLSADLFNRRVGLLAVYSLGTLAFFQYFSHEFRPYTALMLFTVAAQLTFLRWLRRPNLKHALLYVVCGIAVIYTHFFGMYVIGAQALVFVLLVRWRPGLYLRAVGLFAAVGFSFIAWLPSFIYSFTVKWVGGVSYFIPTQPDRMIELYSRMQVRPLEIGGVLLVAALLLSLGTTRQSSDACFRLWQRFDWRRAYVLWFLLIVLLLAFTANLWVRNVTARNLAVIVPSLAIVVAVGLAALPRYFVLPLLLVIAVPALSSPVFYRENAPYLELTAFIKQSYQPGAHVVTNNEGRNYLDLYLMDRADIPQHDLYRVLRPMLTVEAAPREAQRILRGEASPLVAEFLRYWQFLKSTDTVFYIESAEQRGFGADYRAWLERQYLPLRSATFDDPGLTAPHTITEYRRIPKMETLFVFEDITLQSWRLLTDVDMQACASIGFESWWTTQQTPSENYSQTFVLANQSGMGVANVDGAPANILTRQWQRDQVYRDVRELTIPCDTPPGEYPLLVGLYNFETGESLPVTTRDGEPVAGLVYLTTIFVE